MIDIKPEDLHVSTYSCKPRSAWATHTQVGIKIAHGPSGIFTTSESARSQHQNRALAMEELHFKLKGRDGVERTDVQAEGIAERQAAIENLNFPDDTTKPHNEHMRAKAIATKFFYWWHNQPGSNTEQGFDDWWGMNGDRFK